MPSSEFDFTNFQNAMVLRAQKVNGFKKSQFLKELITSVYETDHERIMTILFESSAKLDLTGDEKTDFEPCQKAITESEMSANDKHFYANVVFPIVCSTRMNGVQKLEIFIKCCLITLAPDMKRTHYNCYTKHLMPFFNINSSTKSDRFASIAMETTKLINTLHSEGKCTKAVQIYRDQ